MTILDIIRRPVFYLKHNVSETEFCLLLQVVPTVGVYGDRVRICRFGPNE
jgi:hypothetical protein